MKVLITGDRCWTDRATVRHALLNILPDDGIIVHGGARGADSIAGEIAKKWDIKTLVYPAEWTKFGAAAGPIRNRQMLKENPDIELVLAFHNNINQSKGTKDMCSVASKQGLPVRLYDCTGSFSFFKTYKPNRNTRLERTVKRR